jgi:hypothetical protein
MSQSGIINTIDLFPKPDAELNTLLTSLPVYYTLQERIIMGY